MRRTFWSKFGIIPCLIEAKNIRAAYDRGVREVLEASSRGSTANKDSVAQTTDASAKDSSSGSDTTYTTNREERIVHPQQHDTSSSHLTSPQDAGMRNAVAYLQRQMVAAVEADLKDRIDTRRAERLAERQQMERKKSQKQSQTAELEETETVAAAETTEAVDEGPTREDVDVPLTVAEIAPSLVVPNKSVKPTSDKKAALKLLKFAMTGKNPVRRAPRLY